VTAVRALLIGLDGATFSVLDPLMTRGVMPSLRELVARGARAPLRSVLPPLTPPGWTSLMTGQRPGEHGVFDFFQRETVDSEYFHFASSLDVHSPTIWSLASQADQRVISLNFPLMFPAPAVKGCVVPGGWMPWQLRLGCHPSDLFDRLKSLPSFNARELALDMAFEVKAIEGCAAEEYADWIDLHIRRERRWCDILTYLLREEPAALVGVVFDGVDKLQHLCWRFLDPACQPAEPSLWEREITARCESYFRQLDGIIGELVELAGPEATVVLASDHGFGPSSDVFYLNTWLEQQGYLSWIGEGEAPSPDGPQVGFGQITRHIYQLNWERTVAYAATPSSQGIHIVRPPRMTDGDYRRCRDELAARLRQVRLPGSGRPLATAVVTREEAFAGPHQALAPDLSLELNDGVAISILQSEALFARRPEPRGNHRWDGMLAAVGPGIRAGAAVGEISIVDVAPLLLHCLDLPAPLEMSGRVPVELFEPDELRRRPPRLAARTAPPAARPVAVPSGAELDAEGEEVIVKRLRALGYVE
jgi:predicted AlkP superfamily phosphohydrolase/phosphomutase